jgi:ribosomal protein S18 acetylase RimI-like enzyme
MRSHAGVGEFEMQQKSASHSPVRFLLRDAVIEDLSLIIRIVNSKNNRSSFGFVPKVVLADAVNHQLSEGISSQHRIRVVVDSVEQRVVGWLRAYHRRDGVTTLHELGVSEDCQNLGLGTLLVDETISACRSRGMQHLRLKTLTVSRTNQYYPRFGFKFVSELKGYKRPLNLWNLAL